jgi:hypothetical protein
MRNRKIFSERRFTMVKKAFLIAIFLGMLISAFSFAQEEDEEEVIKEYFSWKLKGGKLYLGKFPKTYDLIRSLTDRLSNFSYSC